jgi:hypothetical protein
LSDGSGHVLSLERRSTRPDSVSTVQTIKVGVRQASTFPGLCAQHDAALFRSIDCTVVHPTSEQLFLLSYRSALREQYVGRWVEKFYANSLSLAVKARMSKSFIIYILANLNLTHWGNQRLDKIAAFYGMLHEQKIFEDALIPLTGQNIRPLPFAVSGFFEPVFNPDGSRIPPGVGTNVGPFLTLNVVPHEGGSIAVLTYPLQFRDSLHNFLQPFRPPINEKVFVDRVWETALRYCENIILAPWYWEMVPERVQEEIVTFYHSTYHAWIPSPGAAISLFDWIDAV